LRTRLPPTLLAVAALAAALAAGCVRTGSGEPFTLVSVDDVARMIGDPRVAIVDANPEDVFRRGHVPGARWYRAGPSLASVLPPDKGTRLVFYCASPG
jgi:rhodanese-related sulfurtransferase